MAWIISCVREGNRPANVRIETKFDSRFFNDKVHIVNEIGEAVLDGVLLNSRELILEFGGGVS